MHRSPHMNTLGCLTCKQSPLSTFLMCTQTAILGSRSCSSSQMHQDPIIQKMFTLSHLPLSHPAMWARARARHRAWPYGAMAVAALAVALRGGRCGSRAFAAMISTERKKTLGREVERQGEEGQPEVGERPYIVSLIFH